MFVHLNCHSNYSLLAGTNRVDDLVRAAAAQGCPALALTDTNGLYGAIPFYQAALKAHIRPILGTEIITNRRATLLAKNLRGFGEICRIITRRHLQPGFSLEKCLEQCSHDVIILCPDENLLENTIAVRGGEDIYAELLAAGADGKNPDWRPQAIGRETGSGLFPPGVGHHTGRKVVPENPGFAQRSSFGEQSISQFPPSVTRRRAVATNRVFFIRPEDWQIHRLLTAIRTGTTVDASSALHESKELWMKPPEEMVRLFHDIPEAIRNTLDIAEQCNVVLPIGEIRLPNFPLHASGIPSSRLVAAGAPSVTLGPISSTLSRAQRSTQDQKLLAIWPRAERPGVARLRRLAREGAVKLYGHPPPSDVSERLRYELEVIDNLDFASYFLIVWDIVREAKARGIPTVGRGSAANSLVCRVLGITEVDPIEHNLYFERFLNPERTDYPDIDIDFPWNRRDEMLEYVFNKYGHENVALISTHVHFRGRSALREVGKALGVPLPEIDAFVKRLPHSFDVAGPRPGGTGQTPSRTQSLEVASLGFCQPPPRRAHYVGENGGKWISRSTVNASSKAVSHLAPRAAGLEEVRKLVPECRDLPLEDEPYRSIIALSKRIDGFPRHLSIHCGGIVISPFPITDRIPLQKTPKGFVVTQYDMYPVEDMGLLKIDLLAQKGLAVLADTVQNVKTLYGTKIDFSQIDPTRDSRTRRLIRQGKTIGCFYIESPGMRNLLQKLEVDSFDMLTAASSIIRPGVADSGMMKAFIDRHNGREKVHYLHPKMEEILKETFGVMIYQEDVIKVAHAIAGMSLGEADSLRKCMSKKRDWEDINNHRERFFSGARANGIAKKIIEEIWRQIESFAGYAFCKAHSASFALVSYQCAYLKAHYPTEFMAAVLSNRGGFYDACAYTEEARRMGIKILAPHVNHSAEEFMACGKRAMYVGLGQVKGLSHHTISTILKHRKDGPYVSVADFLSRVEASIPETEALIRCGALDGARTSRPELLWQLKLLTRAEKNGPMASLPFTSVRRTRILKLPEYTLREKVLAELEHLDLAVSAHLLLLYDVNQAGLTQARDLVQFPGCIVTLAGWLVTAKSTWTVQHQLMKFLMLEDATASFEVTLFPKVYRRFGPLLYDRGPYIVKGRVESEGRCHTITALWLGRCSPTRRGGGWQKLWIANSSD
ncbi:MAG: DNA polymerase III subunit alpha [Nitrospinota bacterium]|nr:DNA polymerase III subunit alpha [Nitrospinota bacterium]